MQNSSQIVTINEPTPNVLQAECPSCRQTNSVKALKGNFIIFLAVKDSDSYYSDAVWLNFIICVKEIEISLAHIVMKFNQTESE